MPTPFELKCLKVSLTTLRKCLRNIHMSVTSALKHELVTYSPRGCPGEKRYDYDLYTLLFCDEIAH